MTTQRGSAGSRPIAVAVAAGAAGAALALGALWAAGQISSPARAQDPPSAGGATFKVTPAQLRINQRISQAAVRRSNESLSLLDPIRPMANQPAKVLGWGTDDLRDGAVTGPKVGDGAIGPAKLAPALAARLPMWAYVNAAGTVVRARPDTVTATRVNAGNYRVDFGRDLNACGFTGTQHVFAAGQIGFIGLQVDATNPDLLAVRTTSQPTATENAVSADRPFLVQVTC